ncbi:hypothetical protein WJX74_008265 [Apatococcus lobatus]|uniref:alpha-1,2-Mannosidase n=1 Tax=Apatococcus lobatus TaxID=904363 RepID=A0AAW1QKD2_9CHLO
MQEDDAEQAPPLQQPIPPPYAQAPVSASERTTLREGARWMFYHAFNSYMTFAFPKDDLRPLSCSGTNSQGGLALTLVDALDTLAVLGDAETLRDAVQKLDQHLDFRIDHRVHVFELTIRALGALLSAHHMLMTNQHIMPGYDGSLLRFAVDLGDRLVPSFNTPYGVPLSWINLEKGMIPGDLRVTCTACAGTLLLEFGALSRMTGQPLYESLAKQAVEVVYGMRSTTTGLLGNTLDVDSLYWVRVDGGVGAGIDSFYEYLLKAYLAFGDPGYLRMFVEVYAAAMQRLQLAGRWASTGWLADMHIGTGQLLHPWISSLSAFWPGLQVLAGQVDDAARMHTSWMAAWTNFGGLPELFDISITQLHPVQRSYPLRPELIESTYLLHSITGDDKYLKAGRALQETIANKTLQHCGFATIADLATGQLEDSMESFFLPETSKYLYLLNSNAAALPDYYVFSTEGHLLPPFPHQPPTDSPPSTGSSSNHPPPLEFPASMSHDESSEVCASPIREPQRLQMQGSQTKASPALASQNLEQRVRAMDEAMGREGMRSQQQRMLQAQQSQGFRAMPRNIWNLVANAVTDRLQTGDPGGAPSNCLPMCEERKEKDLRKEQRSLRRSFPLLDFSASKSGMLRERRCNACKAVSSVMQTMAQLGNTTAAPRQVGTSGMLQDLLQKLLPSGLPKTSPQPSQGLAQPAGDVSFAGGEILQQLLCHIKVDGKGGMQCGRLEDLGSLQITTSSLPDNTAVLMVQREDSSTTAPGAESAGIAPEQTSIQLRLHHAEDLKAHPQDQTFPAVAAAFGPSLADAAGCLPNSELYCGMTGKLRASSPLNGCQSLADNAQDLQGAIALLERGTCMFAEKVQNAATAGARAAVIVNNLEGGHLIAMGDDGRGTQPPIPAVLVDADAGLQLTAAMKTWDPWVTLSDFGIQSLQSSGGRQAAEDAAPIAAAGSCAAGTDAQGAAGSEQHTRIDVLVPPQSQAWMAKQPGVVDIQAAMNSVLQAAASALGPPYAQALQASPSGQPVATGGQTLPAREFSLLAMASRRRFSFMTGRRASQTLQEKGLSPQQADQVLVAVEEHGMSKFELSAAVADLKSHTTLVAWKTATAIFSGTATIMTAFNTYGYRLVLVKF